MTDLIKILCDLDGVSGNEGDVREFIIEQIKDFCEYKIDALGNILVFKKGERPPVKKVMLDAHMDEVGFIITDIDQNGFLRFKTVGGIDTSVLLSRRVRISGGINGVIGAKPVHLCSGEELKKLPAADSLYIDIGASDRDEVLGAVKIGDCGVIESSFVLCGDRIISKALDNRVGCAVLIKLISEESPYDFCASFSVQEEVGLRGARTAAYVLDPEIAIVLEGTTAADIAGVDDTRRVCTLGQGAAISFMDGASLYDRGLFDAARESNIKHQLKCAATGGNNAGSIHLSRSGIRTAAISVPCRYIHSAASVADIRDVESAYRLARYMYEKAAAGEI